jgi:hypothetical protein
MIRDMTKAAEWAERVRAWRESGDSAPAFARGKSYSAKQLWWWSGELGRRERKGPRVKLAQLVRVRAPGAPLTVAVGAARVEVRAGFDRALLREIVEALGGAQ